jgi:putative membrane protein
MSNRISPLHLGLLLVAAIVFVWSAWRPYDRATWWLEVSPAVIGAVILISTYSRFRFTTLVYTMVMLHMILLFVGGHYTYARVPLFQWMEPVFGWQRNHFDRLGHFMQGLVPALIARELFVRLRVVNSAGWRFSIILLLCMGISAIYELLEWATALVAGAAASAFLGTHGDLWDTHQDMFMALLGAFCALIFFSYWQNRQMRTLPSRW